MHGNYPTYAPVNPYTELADIFNAFYLLFNNLISIGSVDLDNSNFTFFLAVINSSNIIGNTPFFTVLLIKKSLFGVLSY
jgi:hypothetical protein